MSRRCNELTFKADTLVINLMCEVPFENSVINLV